MSNPNDPSATPRPIDSNPMLELDREINLAAERPFGSIPSRDAGTWLALSIAGGALLTAGAIAGIRAWVEPARVSAAAAPTITAPARSNAIPRDEMPRVSEAEREVSSPSAPSQGRIARAPRTGSGPVPLRTGTAPRQSTTRGGRGVGLGALPRLAAETPEDQTRGTSEPTAPEDPATLEDVDAPVEDVDDEDVDAPVADEVSEPIGGPPSAAIDAR